MWSGCATSRHVVPTGQAGLGPRRHRAAPVSSQPWSQALLPTGEEDGRDQSKLETKVWEAHNPLVDKQIDQFLVVAR